MSKKGGLGKFLLGAGIGVGLGLLFSPRTGKQNREILKSKIEDFANKLNSMESKEIKNDIQKRIDTLLEEIEDLDKEKILKIAKAKSKEIKNKAEELVEYVVEKGTPVLEKSATAIKEKAIEVTKEILKKLEQEEK